MKAENYHLGNFKACNAQMSIIKLAFCGAWIDLCIIKNFRNVVIKCMKWQHQMYNREVNKWRILLTQTLIYVNSHIRRKLYKCFMKFCENIKSGKKKNKKNQLFWRKFISTFSWINKKENITCKIQVLGFL